MVARFPKKTMQGLALSGPEPISKRIRLAGSAFCPFVQKSPRACTSWPMLRRQNKEVRPPAAPLRMEGGREKDKQGKSGQDRGRKTGGGNLQDCPECRSADSDAGQGGRINIENHENRFADMERGRTADGKGLSDNSNNSRQWFWRQLGQPGTTLSRCRADNPARRKVANGM